MTIDSIFPQGRDIDCITIGRANVDCYPDEGETLDKARHYNVFVGGSPANISAGIARHDLKAAIITKVAKDAHGAFVVNYLSQNFGIDVSHIIYDESGARTSLAFAECRPDADVIMYRHNVADLNLEASEIDEHFIARSKSVFISGTALTFEPSRAAVLQTLEYARKHGVVCAMDIDYRPYGWESPELASQVLTDVAGKCDIILGTRDEFEVSGAPNDISDEKCADYFLQQSASLVVVKRGKDGSLCIYNEQDKFVKIEGTVYLVDMKKPYGAGDAFASTFLSMLIKGSDISTALQYAAASASINISGVSCTEEMPTEQEIESFISKY